MELRNEKPFGKIIREARQRKYPPLSLRKFAEMIGIAPAYLSKVESDQDRPPAADKVEKICEILGLDKVEMLKLANRTPTELVKAFQQDSRAPEFLRVAMGSGLTPAQLREMIEKNKNKKPE